MSTNTLNESNTLERARLNLKYKTNGLDVHERARRSILLSGDPATDLSLGGKAATGQGFLNLAAKAAKASDRAGLTLDGDVSLAKGTRREQGAAADGSCDISGCVPEPR